MTIEEFKTEIKALASELNARVEIEDKGMEITQAVVYAGNRIAFFVTLNSYFDKIELMESDGEEKEIKAEELKTTFALCYFSAVSKHLADVSEALCDIMKG